MASFRYHAVGAACFSLGTPSHWSANYKRHAQIFGNSKRAESHQHQQPGPWNASLGERFKQPSSGRRVLPVHRPRQQDRGGKIALLILWETLGPAVEVDSVFADPLNLYKSNPGLSSDLWGVRMDRS